MSASPSTEPIATEHRAPRWAVVVAIGAVVLLLGVMVMRVTISFSPRIYWDTDPRSDTLGPTGFGPLGTMVTNGLCIASLVLAVGVCLGMRRRVHVGLIGLWAAGLPFVFWHSMDGVSAEIGFTWCATLAAGLAAMHLAAIRPLRRVLLAGMLGLVVPLAAQAVVQVAVDHRATVENYRQNREEILAQHGWEPDSVDAKQYEARLEQNEATGRMGLANVFGSVMMTLTLIALGNLLGKILPGATIRKHVPEIVLVVCGAVALGLTFSKGAVLAMVAAVGAMGVVWLFVRSRCMPRWFWPSLAVLVVLAGIGGVLVRGAMGPPADATGERSLLFRYYYWQAATAMIAEQPITGIGPGQFQQEYLRLKNPLNPEEPRDPHNTFLAYLSTLGVGGAAWSALLILLLVLVSLRCNASEPPIRPTDPPMLALPIFGAIAMIVFGWGFVLAYPMGRGIMLAVAAIAVVVGILGVAAWAGKVKNAAGQPVAGSRIMGGVLIALAYFGPTPILSAWWMGLVGYIAAAWWLAHRHAVDTTWGRMALQVAMVAMLLHSQIEMSLTQTMSGPLLLGLLGIAAANTLEEDVAPRGGHAMRAIVGGLLAMAVLVAMMPELAETWRVQSQLAESVEVLRRQPDRRGVEQAERILAQVPGADALADRTHLLIELGRIDEALAAVREAPQQDLFLIGPRLWNIEANAAEEAWRRTNQPRYRHDAIVALTRALEQDPYNLAGHLRLADLLWEADRKTAAAAMYRKALELHEQYYLIPFKQLTAEQLQEARERSEAGDGD